MPIAKCDGHKLFIWWVGVSSTGKWLRVAGHLQVSPGDSDREYRCRALHKPVDMCHQHAAHCGLREEIVRTCVQDAGDHAWIVERR